MRKNNLALITFVVLYSIFVFFINIDIDLEIASELMVASVFFFALFSGFFIARQNDRFSKIVDIIAERDGLYSYLYRVFMIVPRIQNELREIIKAHYMRIINSNNWAFNELNPSSTINNVVKAISSVNEKEATPIETINPFDGLWDTILQLQQNRKKIIAAYNERLLFFQWILIYIFAGLVIFCFAFFPTEMVLVNILKVIFSTAVFLVIILIKQLNDLSIFGKNFSHKIANDVIRVIDEIDAKELREMY